MKENFGQIKMQFPLKSEKTQNLPFYIINIGSMENQQPCYRPNGLGDYQFLYCTAGQGHLIINEKDYIITPGMGMYFRPFVAHEYYAEKEPWTTHWIMFTGSAVDTVPFIKEMGHSFVFYIYAMQKLSLMHKKIYSLAETNGLLNINDISVFLYKFLLDISSCVGNTQKNNQYLNAEHIYNVITYIENNYEKDISLNQLANIADITPQHLCRLFKEIYHMRPIEYLNDYRIKYAKHLLISQKELTLKEIAAQIGFHDISYFCSVFKKSEGVTPKEFKNMH